MGKVVKGVGNAIGGLFGKKKPPPSSGGGGGGADPFNLAPESQEAKKRADDQLALASERSRLAAASTKNLITDLEKQARGEGPSLAEAQLKSATSRNLAQQLAAASSGRGGNPAALQRQLLQQQGAAGRDLAEQAAQARIQEQAGARQQLAQTLGQEQQLADQLTQQYIQRGFDFATASKMAQQQRELSHMQGQTQRDVAKRQQSGGIIGGLLGGIGSILSDENEKKYIKPAKKEVNSFLNSLAARQFSYKNPENNSEISKPSGKHYGILAQDLERSKIGKSLVKNTKHGKVIDTAQGFGAVLAAQAELHNRIKALEKSKK